MSISDPLPTAQLPCYSFTESYWFPHDLLGTTCSYHSMPTPQVVVVEIKGKTNQVCAEAVLFFVTTCIAHLGISSSIYTCKRMPRAHNLVTARFPPCGVRHGRSVFPSFQTESFEPPEEHHHDNDHFTFVRPSADKPV
jgi:hypothetical protein